MTRTLLPKILICSASIATATYLAGNFYGTDGNNAVPSGAVHSVNQNHLDEWPAFIEKKGSSTDRTIAIKANPSARGRSLFHVDNMQIEFSVDQYSDRPNDAQLTIRNLNDNRLVEGLSPKVWLHPSDSQTSLSAATCQKRIQRYLSGTLFEPAQIDLNRFRLIMLNDDATITAINPQLSLRRTRLESILQLEEQPHRWLINPAYNVLVLAMNHIPKLVFINLNTLEIEHELPLNQPADAMLLSPDGKYLWWSHNHGELVAIDMATRQSVANLSIGRGSYQLVFSDEGQRLWVTNPTDGWISSFDIKVSRSGDNLLELVRSGRVFIGDNITGLIEVNQQLILARANPNEIVVIQPNDKAIYRMPAGDMNIDSIAADPSGKWIFAIDKMHEQVGVFDNKKHVPVGIIQGIEAPDDILFSNGFGYLINSKYEDVVSIALNTLERSPNDAMIPLTLNPIANNKRRLGKVSVAIDKRTDDIYLASPAQRSIQIFSAGQSKESGRIQNPVGSPIDLFLNDQSLYETTPGHYQTRFSTRLTGQYDVFLWSGLPDISGVCTRLEITTNLNTTAGRN